MVKTDTENGMNLPFAGQSAENVMQKWGCECVIGR